MGMINIFGYGSLLWNPEKRASGFRKATLYGWHRNYNVLSGVSRGTRENKGLVLGLARGGKCEGYVFQIPANDLENWKDREGLGEGIYLLKSVKKDGLKIAIGADTLEEDCLLVVPNKDSPAYVGHWTLRRRAMQAIRSSRAGGGKKGTSVDYINNNYESYKRDNIHDPKLEEMYLLVKELQN